MTRQMSLAAPLPPPIGALIEIKVRGAWVEAKVTGLGSDSHAGRGRVVFFVWTVSGLKGAMWSGASEWRRVFNLPLPP